MSDHREVREKVRGPQLLTVKEYAEIVRLHPLSVYRRIREGRQAGVHRLSGTIRLNPPDDEDEDGET
jgi:hypothetical protein